MLTEFSEMKMVWRFSNGIRHINAVLYLFHLLISCRHESIIIYQLRPRNSRIDCIVFFYFHVERFLNALELTRSDENSFEHYDFTNLKLSPFYAPQISKCVTCAYSKRFAKWKNIPLVSIKIETHFKMILYQVLTYSSTKSILNELLLATF